MPTLTALKAANAADIGNKIAEDSIAPTDVSGRLDALVDELLPRGIYFCATTGALLGLAGDDTQQAYVKNVGIFYYSATGGPANGTTIFNALGGGFWYKDVYAGQNGIPPIIEVSASQALDEPAGVTDIIEVDASAGPVNLTLNDIPAGKSYIIKKVDNLGFHVTFDTESPQTLTKQGDCIMIYSAGGGTYRVIADYTLPTVISISATGTLPTPASAGTTVKTDCSGGTVTLTLPLASDNPGRIFRLKKMDSSGNAMNVNALEGLLSVTTQYAGFVLQSDGTNWFTIGIF